MSGVTCQFCGKPLWRIRRGTEGDFCSREHRNQYKLRMGLSHLVEAEKVDTVRRRCENPNVATLGRPAGSPELQRRRLQAVKEPKSPSLPVIDGGLSQAGIPERHTLPAITAMRRPLPPPVSSRALVFVREPVLTAGGSPRPSSHAIGVMETAIREPRVPLATGGLNRPIFLIARFANRRPGVPGLAPRKVTKRSTVPVPLACRPRTGTVESPRVASAAFVVSPPRFRETVKPNDLSDMVCVTQPLMPYRMLDAPAVSKGHGQIHLVGAAPSELRPVDRDNPPLAKIWQTGLGPKIHEIEPFRLDVRRQPRSARVASEPHAQPALPPMQGNRSGPASLEPRFRALPGTAETGQRPGTRSATVQRRRRVVGRGRRAAWQGRTRLPGFPPKLIFGAPELGDVVGRMASLPCRTAGTGAVLPSLSIRCGKQAEVGPRRVAAALSGARAARAVGMPLTAPDLMVVPRRPMLLGSLADPLPGGEVVVIEEHFAKGLDQWTGDKAAWKVDLAGVRPAAPALFVPSLGLSDFRLEFLARVERGSLTCLFRADSPQDCHVLRIGSGGGSLERYTLVAGAIDSRASAALTGIAAGKSLNIQLDVRGSRFRVAVNGRLIDQWSDNRLPAGAVGFASSSEDRVRLYWVKITHGLPEHSELETRQL